MRNALLSFVLLMTALLILSACQTNDGPSNNISINTNQGAQSVVVHMAKRAQECWFKSKDPAFKQYSLASEVNSFSGRPRFLIVPKSNPGGLPLLVVQAETKGDAGSGKFTNIQSFGPLLQKAGGQKISADIRRWSTGKSACA